MASGRRQAQHSARSPEDTRIEQAIAAGGSRNDVAVRLQVPIADVRRVWALMEAINNEKPRAPRKKSTRPRPRMVQP